MQNDDPKVVEDANLVELVENSLHPLTEELKRWQLIIGEHYFGYKVQEQRDLLVIKPEGYSTTR